MLFFVSLLSFVLFAFAVTAEKCCTSCNLPQIKYYSIARQYTVIGKWNCGESCIDPKDYETYLKYEPNLLPANSSNPCLENGFDIFVETETHGFGPTTATLDMYTKEQ